MDDKRLAEIESEFCPTIGVTREPSHGVPALIAEVRRLRAENATLRALADSSASLVRQGEVKEREACAEIARAAREPREARLRRLEREGIDAHDPARLALIVAITDAERIEAQIRARGNA